MYVAVEQIHQSLTLYRGEVSDLRRDILMRGVGGRLGNLNQLRLVRLPIDLLAHLGHPEIAEHVIHGSHGSPFASWTESPQTAAWYALDSGRRPHGIVLEVTLHLRRRSWWDHADGTWSVAYQDHPRPAADPDRRIRCADSACGQPPRRDRGDSRTE